MMKKIGVIITHWFVGWGLCGATMMVGREVTSIENALIIHAILAPVFFGIISVIYFKRFGYTTPLQTAAVFTLLIIMTDALFVAPIIEKSYEMFTSFIGTWLVFILIFLSTFITGSFVKKHALRSS
jgi:hypothetical protein